MTYFNSTNLVGDELTQAQAISENQDALVMKIFRHNRVSETLSPSEVWNIGRLIGSDWLLTSVRRSITGLEHAGALVKTDLQSQGPHGRPEHRWRLA